MVQGRKRLDAVRQQLVHQPVVEIEALGFGERHPPGRHAATRSRNDKPLRRALPSAERLPGTDGSGRVRCRHCCGRKWSRRMGEAVPDRCAAAVCIDGSLDLIGKVAVPDKNPLGTGRGGRLGPAGPGRGLIFQDRPAGNGSELAPGNPWMPSVWVSRAGTRYAADGVRPSERALMQVRNPMYQFPSHGANGARRIELACRKGPIALRTALALFTYSWRHCGGVGVAGHAGDACARAD